MKINFTQHNLASVRIEDGQLKVTVTDAYTQGLQYELRSSGGFFSYRYTFEGRQKAVQLGRYGVIRIADARKRALELGRMVAMGEDPLALKQQQRNCPLFWEFFQNKYMPYIQVSKRSWKTDESIYRNHLKPAFGTLKMNQISKGKVLEFLHMKAASGSAKGSINRMLVLMRYCFNLALEWECPGLRANPTAGIKPFKENNLIERYLSQAESNTLKIHLEQSRNPQLKYIVGLLLVTGARKSEALRAKWEDMDMRGRVWRIPLSKSGKARHITLSDTAVKFLDMIKALNVELMRDKAKGCEYVFPNPGTGKPFLSIFYSWDTARRKAGLGEVRIHDLRHTFASTLVNQGVSLYEVQKLLGHANIKTTERYAHLRQEKLLESAALAGQVFKHLLISPEEVAQPKIDSQ